MVGCTEVLSDILARAYVRHSQIVSALYQHEGTDRFVRERGSLCCNVRRLCHTICDDNGGVEIATALDGDDQVPELKYKPPPLGDLTRMLMEHMSSLQTSEIDAVYKAMDADDPWFDYVVDAWVTVVQEYTKDAADTPNRNSI